MFVNKIINVPKKQVFKGYQREVNDYGEKQLRFNYPHDHEKVQAEIKFYKLEQPQQTDLIERGLPQYTLPFYNAKEESFYTLPINSEEGATVTLNKLREHYNFKEGEPLAYKVFLKSNGKEDSYKDSGLGIGIGNTGQFATFLPTNIGAVQGLGSGALIMPKVHRPGVYRDFETDIIHEDPQLQIAAENTITHFSSNPGGGLVGIIHDLDELAKTTDVIFLNPFAGADNKSHHGYWNKNNKQISDDMGTINDFNELARGLFKRSMTMVNDGTFTSEGLEGVHFQYALRWAGHDAQPYYWFRMSGLKNAPISLGVIPNNKKNISHRVINPTHIYDPKTNSVVKSKDYDPNKETLIQLYDKTMVTEEQLSKLDEPIDRYRDFKEGRYVDINSHNDTVINYVFAVNPKEHADRLREFARFNKTEETPVDLYSPEGTMFIGQFSNFKFNYKRDGGIFVWDANTDMVKMSYFLSPYDETNVLANITDPVERDAVRKKMQIGTYQVRDMAVQSGKYWTQKYSDALNLHLIKTIGNIDTAEGLNKLVSENLIPPSAALSDDAVENIIDDLYELSPKGVLSKDEVTIKSLMKLQLDSLELADKTVGILASPYITNLATHPDYIGKSRFELYQQGDPHILKENKAVYDKTTSLYTEDLKAFADKVIAQVNENSETKLLNPDGSYTVYGEYVVDLMGQEIAKYALLKSVMRENLTTKLTLESGEIKYDYATQRKTSAPENLGIRGMSPEDEANKLVQYMKNGIKNLTEEDVSFVASVINNQIVGTNELTFKISEAMLDKTHLILPWRLDAAKDMVDMDAVRNRKMTFDQAWDNVVAFWKEFADGIKSVRPNAVIIAEITNVKELIGLIAGCAASDNSESGYTDNLRKLGVKYASEADAINALMNAGITSEAAYSYTFTDGSETVAYNPENGGGGKGITVFAQKLKTLINHKPQDFTRLLYTFMDNHDKPSTLFNDAVNLGLLFADLSAKPSEKGDVNFWSRRLAMAELTNCDEVAKLSPEIIVNLKNPNYFRTVSAKAIAVSQLLRNCINVLPDSVASSEEKAMMKEALVDIINGNYLGEGKSVNYRTIDIDELSSFEKVLDTIAKEAGVNLGSKRDSVLRILTAHDLQFKENSPVRKNTLGQSYEDATDINTSNNKNLMQYLLQEKDLRENYDEFDLTVAKIAVIINDAIYANQANFSDEEIAKLKTGIEKFVRKYDRNMIDSHRSALPVYEKYEDTMKKEGFGAADFRHSIKMILEQTKYRANNPDLFSSEKANNIYAKLFEEATASSVTKALLNLSYLAGFPGVPTTFLRDIYCGLGFDYKTKNEFVRSRGVTNISDTLQGPLKNYVNSVKSSFEEIMAWRKDPALAPLNDGTPYLITDSVNGGKLVDYYTTTKDGVTTTSEYTPDAFAYLMQGADGNVVIPLMTNSGIKREYWENYKDSNGSTTRIPQLNTVNIEQIEFPSDIDLPEKTIFYYLSAGVTCYCMLEKLGDRSIIRRAKLENGQFVHAAGEKISMNSQSMKNGVMFLKKLGKSFFKK